MKLAFLIDPPEHFKIGKDSTYAMMLEAQRRGYAIFVFEQQDLHITRAGVSCMASRFALCDEEENRNWFVREAAEAMPLTAFSAVINRKDPPVDMGYLYMTYLLEQAVREGAHVWNQPDAVRNHNEKLSIFDFREWMTDTLVSSDSEHIRSFHRIHGDVILKPLHGMGGMGVFRVRADGLNLGAVIESLTMNGRMPVMVQRYLPEIAQGDKRILLIGGKVVPYALARMPQSGEVRANLAAGGTGIAQPLSARDQAIAQAMAPILMARGLLLVGLDVIGDYVTEINVTSPTCFREITAQTGFNVAGMFLDELAQYS